MSISAHLDPSKTRILCSHRKRHLNSPIKSYSLGRTTAQDGCGRHTHVRNPGHVMLYLKPFTCYLSGLRNLHIEKIHEA